MPPTVRARGGEPEAPAYPLKVGPTGRYLVDRHGVPVLLTGDSPQALMVNLSPHQADGFFADRQAAGFNVGLDQPAVLDLHGRAAGRQHLRRDRAVHHAGRPRDAEPEVLRARRPDAPAGRGARHHGVPRPGRDRELPLRPEGERRRQVAAVRPLPGHPVPELRQHRVDERERLPVVAGPGRRRRGPRGRPGHPPDRPPPHPHPRARLPGERFPRRRPVGATSSISTPRTRTTPPTPRC